MSWFQHHHELRRDYNHFPSSQCHFSSTPTNVSRNHEQVWTSPSLGMPSRKGRVLLGAVDLKPSPVILRIPAVKQHDLTGEGVA